VASSGWSEENSTVTEERPLGAFALSLAGGILIFIGGVLLSVAGGIASSVGAYGAGDLLGGIGLLGLLLGFLVTLLAALLIYKPENHTVYGIAIIVMSLASIFAGAGFFLGLILGVAGGVWALRFEEPEPLVFDWELDPNRLGAPGTPQPAARAATPAVCANCRSPLPRGADRCPNCETPVPRVGQGPPPATSAVAAGGGAR
jgi:hypothetical protein